MEVYLNKTFTASMPLKQSSDELLRLAVYGTAFVSFHKMKDQYTIVDIKEEFINNDTAEYRSLLVTLVIKEIEKTEVN